MKNRWFRKPLYAVLLVLSLFLSTYFLYYVFSSLPSGSTCTVLVNARFNPTQGLSVNSNNIYVMKTELTLNNLSFPNRSLKLTQDGVGYWANVTSGSNLEIHIYQWFYDERVTQFFLATSASYSMRLYVGSLGEPEYATGTTTWSYSGGNVDFTATGPTTVAFFWTSYNYVFHGLYNENGTFEGTVDVTGYFTDGTYPDTFTVNGTYTYGANSKPQYFSFDLGSFTREYWLGNTEDNAIIYVFNNTNLQYYYINFLDLAGATKDYPIIEACQYINGTLRIVEKRKLDKTVTARMALQYGQRYYIKLIDGAEYYFGDVFMGTSSAMQLTLKGIDFPQDSILSHRYVHMYAYRSSNNITAIYEDLKEDTTVVRIYIKYANGTVAHNYNATADTFSYQWLNADNSTSYYIIMQCVHGEFGTIEYRAYLPRGFTDPPFDLDVLWPSSPITTSVLFPLAIIICVMGVFSSLNVPIGCFATVATATFLTWIGWISIPAPLLVGAWVFTFLIAIVYARRSVHVL